MVSIRYKKIKAMSLLSLLLILTMIVVIMAASVPMISQNLVKISKGKKKGGEVSLTNQSGYFICYYNTEDKLCHKQVGIDSQGNTNVVTDETCGEPENTPCIFQIPEADSYEITLVGGGGGGATSKVKTDFDSRVENGEKKVKFSGGSATFSSNLYNDFSEYVDKTSVESAINRFFDDTSVFIKKYGKICRKNYGGGLPVVNGILRLSFKELGIDPTNPDCSNTGFYTSLINIIDPDNDQISYENDALQFKVQQCNSGAYVHCIDANEDSSLNVGAANYGVLHKKGGVYENIFADNKEAKFILKSFSTKTLEGKSGYPGEVIKRKTSFIAEEGATEIKFDMHNIGKGGDPGKVGDEFGKSGEPTSVTLNGVKMIANGGAGGAAEEVDNFLGNIKLGVEGENGKKPAFYIPSPLGIDQSKMVAALGAKCASTSCTQTVEIVGSGGKIKVQDSKYPGSSGASSGYNIGKDSFMHNGKDLRSRNMAKIVTEDNTVLYPIGETSPPALTPKFADEGGRGANGAILITW